MSQYPDPQVVVDDLGDKFLRAFVVAVDTARADLAVFEEFKPQWFVNFSKRFVANFIHERMWDSMTSQVASHPEVTVVDEEPTRQIHYGANYVVRFKRHAANLRIETFPTSGALAFWTNQAALPGLELVTLAMGYIWEPELGEIGEAILSFRDGKNNPVWSATLTSPAGGEATGITWEPIDPQLPQLDLSDVVEERDEGTTDQP
ncbi:hypothetical protein OLG66_24350 [Mycobacterium senegalense]|uniref:hypothetical protein n=1 Tax=Mycolicibacterium senegalense TaxID=1796 RepID=UPI00222142A7|nr:hypothetical protein [Mycolicibacterium senegalense]MCW1824054.1 hypothetical protein [Mycolicibacterium senegalense]